MPWRIIHPCIVDGVKPYQFVAALVEAAGGPFRVARAMRAPSFQPTLHKFVNGQVANPKRPTAERIAKHFRIPVDAIYDERVATQLAKERLGHREDEPAVLDFKAPTDSDWQLLEDLKWLPSEERTALINQVHEKAAKYQAYVQEQIEAIKPPKSKS
jgi:hypothetical protein